jgi:uncharacterized protein
MPTAPSSCLAVLVLSCVAAAVAGVDCGKATTPVEKAVCADPTLSAADAALSGRFAAAVGRALDPQKLRDDELQWLARLGKGDAAADRIATAHRTRIEQLDRQIAALDRLERARDTTEEAARNGCPALFDDDNAATVGACSVTGFGPVGAVEGHAFLYGIYSYNIPAGDGLMRTSVVVYERRADGGLRALYAPQEGAGFFAAPEIIHSAGHTLLHLPGYESGTGDFNLERMFVRRAGAWAPFATDDWKLDLARRLPHGYGARKGVFPDYKKMSGTTLLWRDRDGNCCPTGGRSDFTLGWQGDRLRIKSLRVKIGARYAVW